MSALGKKFRRYRGHRPNSLKETVFSLGRGFRQSETFWALRGVTFGVRGGGVFGVIGRNGAGKSTLLRLVGGVGRPDEGEIHVRGQIGSLLELGAGFHGDLTGRENVFVNGVIAGLTRRELAQRMDAIIEFADLSYAIDSPLRTYSTGMQMRLGFSVAVHTNPHVLLIDELLSVGDAPFQKKCLDRITKFRDDGCAIILVSHDLAQVRRMCDRVLWLRTQRESVLGEAGAVVDQYDSEAEEETMRRTPVGRQADASVAGDLKLGQNRFGSLDIEIFAVRICDSGGAQIAQIHSGDAVHIELHFRAHRPVADPIFGVTAINDVHVKCLEVFASGRELGLSVVADEGVIKLCIERLDLHRGDYRIAVWVYEQEWSFAYDLHRDVYSLHVVSDTPGDAVLQPPHHWHVGSLTSSSTASSGELRSK